MKRLFVYLSLCAALLIFGRCGGNTEVDPRNPYGLDIIDTQQEYLASVAEDPDMELIDLEQFIPGLVLDIRYATTNNFTGKQIYTEPKAYARKPVAEALLAIQQELSIRHLGLKIYDAYRPYSGTLYFYEVYHDTTFVASPRSGSNHNRGFAIDLSIVDLSTGEELQMPTGFDSFTKEAAVDYPNLPENVLANRAILVDAMTSHGFTTYKDEWWHFNYAKDREKYKIVDIPFEELCKD
ncbi:MAG: M15 family metallopeptidase [Bacteroidales bacterium]|nr:M15 family metallopeptidase [Bacteroidales bacterium]MDD4669778.1 M15 family metallopeptidase [Bacteroidales bacterium]